MSKLLVAHKCWTDFFSLDFEQDMFSSFLFFPKKGNFSTTIWINRADKVCTFSVYLLLPFICHSYFTPLVFRYFTLVRFVMPRFNSTRSSTLPFFFYVIIFFTWDSKYNVIWRIRPHPILLQDDFWSCILGNFT